MKKISLLMLILLATIVFSGCRGDSNRMVPYTSQQLKFQIQYLESWQAEYSNDGVVLFLAKSDVANTSSVRESVSVVRDTLPADIKDLDAYVAKMSDVLKAAYPDNFSIVETIDSELDGIVAKQVTYLYSSTGISYKSKITYCLNDGKVYVISYLAGTNTYDRYIGVYTRMLGTFKRV